MRPKRTYSLLVFMLNLDSAESGEDYSKVVMALNRIPIKVNRCYEGVVAYSVRNHV